MMSSSPDSIGAVAEADMLRLTGVKRSTWQNWLRKGILASASSGRYREAEVVEVAVVAAMVPMLGGLRDVRTAWLPQRERVLQALLAASTRGSQVLVLEPRLLRLELFSGETALTEALRPGEATILMPIGDSVRQLREDFWRFARTDIHFKHRKPRKSRQVKQGSA